MLPQSFLIVQTDDPDPELVTSRRLLSSKLLASVPEERMRIVCRVSPSSAIGHVKLRPLIENAR